MANRAFMFVYRQVILYAHVPFAKLATPDSGSNGR